MRKPIPAPIIAVVSELVSEYETHATLDSLFMHAGAPGEPPPESKQAKAMAWLRRVNKDQEVDPISVLGQIIEGYMEEEPDLEHQHWFQEKQKKVERLKMHYKTPDSPTLKAERLSVLIPRQPLALNST